MKLFLWDYKKLFRFCSFNEVEIFHHTIEYDSWENFIQDKKALSCNCICGNPLLFWYWDDEESYDAFWDPTGSDENPKDFDQNPEKYFKRITLIYKKWQTEMGSIVIRVNSQNEPEIKKFIIKNQKISYINKL